MSNTKVDRRDFVKSAVTAGAGIGVISNARTVKGRVLGANDRINLGVIGVGGRGTYLIKWATDAGQKPNTPAQIVAVSDVYAKRTKAAKEMAKCDGYMDYREIINRKDIDAVIIATPDHWHAKIGIDALAAGKHIYLEKPMVQEVKEGAGVIEAQKKSGRVVQIGSQRVSSIIYRKAKELIASGAIGQLNMVEAVYNRNSALGAWQYSIPPDASPATIDWDRFLGDAPKRPFEPIRLFRWRNYRDYGTGVAGDLFIHLFSGIHYVLSSNGPTRVMSTGGLRYWKDGRDVPDVMFGLYDYPQTATHPAFNLTLQVNFADGSGGEESFRFIGNDGVLTIGGNGVQVIRAPKQKEPGYTIDTFPEAVQKEFIKEYRKKYPVSAPEMSARSTENYAAPSGYRDSLDHFKNFFASIRSNQPMVEDATFGLRAAGPALLTNESYFNNRVYEWDPEAMKIVKNKT